MVDGDDAGFRSVKSPRFPCRVDCYAFPDARGLLDRGAQFRFVVLKRRGETPVAKRIGTGLVHFDEVGAFLELLADNGDEFSRAVGVGGIGEDALLRIVTDCVFVPAENVDGIAAYSKPWSGNGAAIDGVANGSIGGSGAFGAHVAFGGEAGHQIVSRGESSDDRALRDGLLDGLQI